MEKARKQGLAGLKVFFFMGLGFRILGFIFLEFRILGPRVYGLELKV